MFNPSGQDNVFGRRLIAAQREAHAPAAPVSPADLQHWLEYWNDAEDASSNLRKFAHWLERARLQQS